MAGRIYSLTQFVDGIDVDGDGIAHLHSIGRWLQQVAVADALDAGMSREMAWILRRTTVASERLPRFGEEIELRTWCSGMAKSIAERTTTITGAGGASLECVAIWVHLDPEARRPARLPAEFMEVYAESAGDERPRTALRHPSEPPADAESFDWYFAGADIDLAGHVNNTMYWRVAEEVFGLDLLADANVELEAEYRGGIGSGDARVLADGRHLWVQDPEGAVAASISIDLRT